VHQLTSPSIRLVPSQTAPEPGRPGQSLPAADVPRPLVGSDREQALLNAWREAHWSLRLTLQEVTRSLGHLEIEPLYAEARRCDNLLNELYRSRAELLARQVRDLLMAHASSAPRPGVAVSVPLLPAVSLPDSAELALLARVRSLSPEDRHLLASMAERLAHRAGSPSPTDR
jgi:hypothetical protein